MKAIIYLEGGGDSKELHVRCREGFRKLLERCGFQGKMPRLVACGGRNSTFDSFKTAHLNRSALYVAMWIDSEDPVADPEATWSHLEVRDGWGKPAGGEDWQVLFMTTCMETLIIADRTSLRRFYGNKLQETALPSLTDLEMRNRHEVQDKLAHATRDCTNAYAKGKRSFEVLGELNPDAIEEILENFKRTRRILKAKL